VASREPLKRVGKFMLTNPGVRASVRGEDWMLHDKGMVGCTLEATAGRTLCVYSLHLFPFFEEEVQ
jgi:hypothetical protein